MKRLKSVIFILTFIFILFLIINININKKPPDITVSVNGTKINYVLGLNTWNSKKYDREDTFIQYMKGKEKEDLLYIPLEEVINITFKGFTPSRIEITDYILNEEGELRYEKSLSSTTPLILNKKNTSFILTMNGAAFLSSQYEDFTDGGVIRGFRINCGKGSNSWEYAFVIRTDALKR